MNQQGECGFSKCAGCPFESWDCDAEISITLLTDSGREIPLNDVAVERARR